MRMLTYEKAKQAEGQIFKVSGANGDTLELILKKVTALPKGNRPEEWRAPFRLLFDGAPGHLCAQGTYALRNDLLGEQKIFIVPVGRDEAANTCRFEAVFN